MKLKNEFFKKQLSKSFSFSVKTSKAFSSKISNIAICIFLKYNLFIKRQSIVETIFLTFYGSLNIFRKSI